MDMSDHPHGDYQVVNKVQALVPPRAIGWLTGQDKDDGHLEFGGWIWRHDLAPLGPSETDVTRTYDWSAVPRHSGTTFGSRRSARRGWCRPRCRDRSSGRTRPS